MHFLKPIKIEMVSVLVLGTGNQNQKLSFFNTCTCVSLLNILLTLKFYTQETLTTVLGDLQISMLVVKLVSTLLQKWLLILIHNKFWLLLFLFPSKACICTGLTFYLVLLCSQWMCVLQTGAALTNRGTCPVFLAS